MYIEPNCFLYLVVYCGSRWTFMVISHSVGIAFLTLNFWPPFYIWFSFRLPVSWFRSGYRFWPVLRLWPLFRFWCYVWFWSFRFMILARFSESTVSHRYSVCVVTSVVSPDIVPAAVTPINFGVRIEELVGMIMHVDRVVPDSSSPGDRMKEIFWCSEAFVLPTVENISHIIIAAL